MANFIVLFTIFNILCIQISFQNETEIRSNVQFMCGASKFLSKCGCGQETDKFQHIPLFKIDCSRLNFKECPSQDILPRFIGHLDLSHNKIINLNDTTIQLSSSTLYYLDFSYNRISFISDKFFQNITHLIHLNLGHNKIDTLNQNWFNNLTQLKELNLQSNKIKTLPPQIFQSLIVLQDLTLSYNNLEQFYEEHNYLSYYLPTSIIKLHLDKTGIIYVDAFMFQDLYRLKELTIAYNPIKIFDNILRNNLEYLDISGSNISNLTTENLMFPKLKTLKMNRMPYLKKINSYTFFNLPQLEELYIEHCIRLTEMDPLAFGYLKDQNSGKNVTLRKFSAAFSGLTFLPDTFQFIFEGLEDIRLQGNAWHCDCKLNWFTYLKKNVRDIDLLRCSSPPSNVNKTIHSLKTDEFECLEKKNIQSSSSMYYKPMSSWLFPTIGVLAIIVIILIGTLIYMGPYGSNTYRSNFRHIGPDSPYHPITIQPNEAEYLNRIINKY